MSLNTAESLKGGLHNKLIHGFHLPELNDIFLQLLHEYKHKPLYFFAK